MDWLTIFFKSFFYSLLLSFLCISCFTIGFRQKYVQVLIYLFEFGKKRIDRAYKLKRKEETPEWESEAETPSSVLQTAKRRLSVSESMELSRSISCLGKSSSEDSPVVDFLLSDVFEFVTSGIDVIVTDQVTQRFVAEDLKSWNLLTRTNRRYEFISFRLSCLWAIGFIFRYWILLPIRVTIFLFSLVFLIITTFFIGLVPNGWKGKRALYDSITRFSYGLFSRSVSLIATYHQIENKPKEGGICVANHTSVIDIVPLGCKTSFALIGQSHDGFLGFLQFILARASHHIFFERTEAKDRLAVTRRLREHVGDPNKLPILIFPEGVCINNSAVMQFKKGSFEVGGIIYPVAIKYDPRFGDAFWGEETMLQHLYRLMTSWAIVCDVWYLPPKRRLEGESAIDFANRVKLEIATRGGLVDLDWDGQLKRFPVKREWKENEQLKYSKKLVHSFPNKD